MLANLKFEKSQLGGGTAVSLPDSEVPTPNMPGSWYSESRQSERLFEL